MSVTSNRLVVVLQLSSGESFEGIRLNDRMDLTLGEFLDLTLKQLEGECKISLPETDDDLIDSRDFHVFSGDKKEEFQLSTQLKHIPYLSVPSPDNSSSPVLILESSIFRSAVEVDIDARVDRRLGTEGATRRNQPPHLATRSVSLGNKGISAQHMVFLAGRKEYDNHSQRLYTSTDITSLVEGESLEESLERALASTMSIDDVNSIHSYSSEASEWSNIDDKSMSKTLSISNGRLSNVSETRSLDRQFVDTNDKNTDKLLNRPKLVLKQFSRDELEQEIDLTTPMTPIKESLPREEMSSTPTYSTESTETPKSPLTSPHGTVRKMKLGSRRSSPLNSDGDSSSLKASPLAHGSFNRTTFKSTRTGTTVISPHHTKVYGRIKIFTIEFHIPLAKIIITFDVRGDNTVAQIKQSLWKQLKSEGYIKPEFDFLWDPEKFTLTYEMNSTIYELYDEQQIFQTSTVAQLWRQEKLAKGLLMVDTKKTESKEEKTLNMAISLMIGIGLYQLQFANNDELDITRRKMVAERIKAVKQRDSAMYSMEVEVHFSTIPPHVKEMIGEDDTLLIRVHYTQSAYQTYKIDMHTTADDFLPQVFPTDPNKRSRFGLTDDCKIDDYVLKVAGRSSYIHGNYELIEFSQIVKAMSKHKDINLALVKKLDPTQDEPESKFDWNLIDESTGLTGTHEELSSLAKPHTDIFTMSMWDIQQRFRIRILGLDSLRDSLNEFDVIYVDVAVYHGGEVLCSPLSTQEVVISKFPRWNQWLVFDISVKNLPKAARLCFAVCAGVRRIDSKRRTSTWSKKDSARPSAQKSEGNIQTDRPLHWVNMQILDHRALLRQGVLRLNLWPYDENGDEGRWGGMCPVGSTAINPDGNNAAVLFVELDSYMHPVACPTEGWGTDDSLPLDLLPFNKEGTPFKSHLEESISSDPLITLDKVQRELLWNFRHQLVSSPEALPKFLKCVDWADLDKVTEAHKLLKIWAPITMNVALELLDYHFADEKVRSKAVKRLSKLTNDEVLVFLLQLIQVLKFEPYHDSALARFLLKKALHSKRIGHFFYWYLRSEMDSPQFSQRFGILLEAYLKGCGKLLFKELQNQHNAVRNIMEIASGLKKHIDKHKGSITDFAKEELKNCQLPELFAPPFDPGLMMGDLQVDKCRVMDSKKSPLWLEFVNMDISATTTKPIKVIAKHGDDLRQDMLTLQMLTLMDSSNGLDLLLIPYGCIATGNEMGMIEVVQDAETVAKIQLGHGSFSTLKDEPLYEWLKKKNPNQKHFEKAIERFIYSCAGYCVATYVLGIGDRHNDNIMVTVTGNLFHIDFGHFLGNTKAFLGVNRERAPFVLTPDFEYVLGKRTSDTFKKFEEIAVKAYLIIRKNANLFINLFSMMKCTGIPELQSVEDLDYLKSVLVLSKTEDQAADHFRQQIQRCLKLQWSTQLNWFAHNVVHR